MGTFGDATTDGLKLANVDKIISALHQHFGIRRQPINQDSKPAEQEG